MGTATKTACEIAWHWQALFAASEGDYADGQGLIKSGAELRAGPKLDNVELRTQLPTLTLDGGATVANQG